MSSLNESSILGKLESFLETPSVKKEVNERIDDIMLGNVQLSLFTKNNHTPEEAAATFIDLLYDEIETCGFTPHMVETLEQYQYSKPYKVSDGMYGIWVYYAGENYGQRESLRPDLYPRGADNIVVLYSDGAKGGKPMGHIEGEWHGKHVSNRREIPHTGFLDRAVIDFKGNYANEYGVTEIKRVDNIQL